jgi:muramidase (phage lysozyme)
MMLTMQQLNVIFAKKHVETGSLDAALTKVTWVSWSLAYQDVNGLETQLKDIDAQYEALCKDLGVIALPPNYTIGA